MSDQQRSTMNNRIPSKRGFKIASLNVNKLSTHIDEIRILLADKCLDVLAIQETKLDVSNNNSDFYICGYELIRRDRLSDGGGGICFYIKATINFSVRTDLPGGGGVLPEKLGRGVRPASQNPYPIYD